MNETLRRLDTEIRPLFHGEVDTGDLRYRYDVELIGASDTADVRTTFTFISGDAVNLPKQKLRPLVEFDSKIHVGNGKLVDFSHYDAARVARDVALLYVVPQTVWQHDGRQTFYGITDVLIQMTRDASRYRIEVSYCDKSGVSHSRELRSFLQRFTRVDSVSTPKSERN